MSTIAYVSLLAQVLQNLAVVARNVNVTGSDADSTRAQTAGRVGELLETVADIAAHGEQAYDELKQFDAKVKSIKESGQPLTDADFDELKAQRQAIHAKADEIRARPLPELLQRPADGPTGDMQTLAARQAALTGTQAQPSFASAPAPAQTSTKPDKINPTLPGAREAIQKSK